MNAEVLSRGPVWSIVKCCHRHFFLPDLAQKQATPLSTRSRVLACDLMEIHYCNRQVGSLPDKRGLSMLTVGIQKNFWRGQPHYVNAKPFLGNEFHFSSTSMPDPLYKGFG